MPAIGVQQKIVEYERLHSACIEQVGRHDE
jgi:hypothetical protein